MSVVPDNANSGNSGGNATSLTVSLTVGAGSRQAVVASVVVGDTNATGIRVVIDGTTTMTLIPGTDSGAVLPGARTMQLGATRLSAGAHSFVLSITSAATFLILGVDSVFDANLPHPFANGTNANGVSASPSLSIPTTPGDMTLDTVADIPYVPGSPTQTQQWVSAGAGGSSHVAAAGVTNNIHGWTLSGSTPWVQSGCSIQGTPLSSLQFFDLNGTTISNPQTFSVTLGPTGGASVLLAWSVLNLGTATVCGIASIRDTAGGNWGKVGGTNNTGGGNGQDAEIWAASFVNPQPGAYTIRVVPTATITGANAYGAVAVMVYQNANLADDLTAVTATGSGTSASLGPFTPVAGDALLAVIKADQFQTTTPTGWNQIHTNHAADVESISGRTGAQTPTWTYGTSANWAAVAVIEKTIVNPTYPLGFAVPRTRPFGTRPKLNHRNRLTDGLLIALALNDGGTDQTWNAARQNFPGSIATASGATYWQSGPEGIGYYSHGTGDYMTLGSNALLSPAPNPCSWSSRFVAEAAYASIGKPWGSWLSVSPYQNWGIFQDFAAYTGYIGIAMGNANGAIDLLLAGLPPGSVHTVTGTWDGTTLRGYVDGLFVASVAPYIVTGMVTGEVRVGANATAQEYWSAPIYQACLWSRCLSASEVFQHALDPYDLFDFGVFQAINTDQS